MKRIRLLPAVAAVMLICCVAVRAEECITAPFPEDGAAQVSAKSGLSWSSVENAVSYNIYSGTNQNTVTQARRRAGDINGDQYVDLLDLLILADQWLTTPENAALSADINFSGKVDIEDFAAVAKDWKKLPDASYVGNLTETTYELTLAYDQTYYWRIDAVTETGICQGPVWTFTTEPDRDLYSDTWVAVDALGRSLPGYAECGEPRENRTAALFYFIWFGEHSTSGPHDITKLLAANPTAPAWGPQGHFHHWGEPELGYYLSNDAHVIRNHAHQLANAGVDLIIIDLTNGWTYTSNYLLLCEVFSQIRAQGGKTPQIAFMANAYADDVLPSLYNNLYAPGLYSDLWFYWKGKPLILTPLHGMVVGGRTIEYLPHIRNFFNMRYSWTWMNITEPNVWKWMDFYPQQYGWHESSSIPEQVSISAGIVPHGSGYGRSRLGNFQPTPDLYGLTGTEDQGIFFAQQWSRLNAIDPEFIFITGWNEWVAQRQVFRGDGTDGATRFLGKSMVPGDSWFIDLYNLEFSRDIEPMKDGYTDNYYYQMIDGIRRYKGVRPPPTPSPAKTITIDGDFSDWITVQPEFRDHIGDTGHRNHPGWGTAGIYTNTTGRNDFVTAKVARDDDYIYFYIETNDAITSSSNPNWMMLFINADMNYSNGWHGYNYVVNMAVNSPESTTLKGTGSGWNWTTVNSDVAYQAADNKMEIRIPRSDIGQGSGSDRVAFDFKWADNIQAHDDILQFSISGDSAPDRRFNYRYDTNTTNPIEITNPSFETPNVSGYEYTPDGTGWNHVGGGFVIADGGSAFGNTAYQGSQVMVLQEVVEVWQAVSGFQPGKTYRVNWAEANRTTLGGNTLRVLIDDTVVKDLRTITDTSWTVQSSNTFTAAATTHTLTFDATNAQGGDRSVFIDAVSITEIP